MIIPDLDDLIIADDSTEFIEELGRDFVYAGGWCTAFFIVRTRKDLDTQWEKPMIWIHRYQKIHEGWKLMAKVHLTQSTQMDVLRMLLSKFP